MSSSCWSDCGFWRESVEDPAGSNESRSSCTPAAPPYIGFGLLPLLGGAYSGLSVLPGSSPPPVLLTLLTKFSCLDLDACIFFVRTSNTSLKCTPTSANFPCNSTITLLL